MTNPYETAEFYYDHTVPQYPIDGLQDVEIRGAICEIIPFSYRKTDVGVWIKQPSHTCIVPVSALVGMATMVLRKAGLAAFNTTIESASHRLGLH
jgi:hypothetical protein